MIRRIYKTLLAEYGRQRWWPVTPPGKLTPEYRGGPTSEREQLEVMLGAILTQNTAWKNVEKALANLAQEQMKDIAKIRASRTSTLARLIRPSGYFNEKAKKLQAFASFLESHPIRDLERLPLQEARALLLGVKGIGPETADSILLYALRKPVFVIDAYTKRIMNRMGLIPEGANYHELQALFENALRRDHRVFNEYHALLVEHGKTICKKTPLCHTCVLSDDCKREL